MIEIFRGVSKLLEMVESSENRWKIASNIRIFPDGKCPFCDQVVRSSCIWKISESICYGRYSICGNDLLFTSGTDDNFHPHVHSDGSICLGRSSNADNALFAGMNMVGAYPNWVNNYPLWDSFFKSIWGHECEELKKNIEYEGCNCTRGEAHCGNRSYAGWYCSRAPGHRGRHRACDPPFSHQLCDDWGEPECECEDEIEDRCRVENPSGSYECIREYGHRGSHYYCRMGRHRIEIWDCVCTEGDYCREEDSDGWECYRPVNHHGIHVSCSASEHGISEWYTE